MPKLWNETIETHRRAVHEAILDAAGVLVSEQGLSAVTMSQLAGRAGIGRATLYKYYDDVEAVLLAWHERQVAHHLEHLQRISEHPGIPVERVQAALRGYALMTQRHKGSDVVAALHRGEHIPRAHQRVVDVIAALIGEAAAAGQLRDDVPPVELATYCLHALAAAATLPDHGVVDRLLTLIMTGMRAQP